MKILLPILAATLFSASCLAQTEVTVTGTFSDAPSYPAEIQCMITSTDTNIMVGGFPIPYVTYASTTTDNSGFYSLTLDLPVDTGTISITNPCSMQLLPPVDFFGDTTVVVDFQCACWASFSLEQPAPFVVQLTPHVSSSDAPYTVDWHFGQNGADDLTSNELEPAVLLSGSDFYVVTFIVTDAGGCTTEFTDTIAVDEDGMLRSSEITLIVMPWTFGSTVGLDDPNEGSPMTSVYPNPGTGPRKVLAGDLASGSYDARIIDLQGRTVAYAVRLTNVKGSPLDIPCPDLPAGTYAIELSGNGRRVVVRMTEE